MIFWYKDLYMDEKVRKQEKKCKKIIEELPAYMEKYGILKLTDIIGGAH